VDLAVAVARVTVQPGRVVAVVVGVDIAKSYLLALPQHMLIQSVLVEEEDQLEAQEERVEMGQLVMLLLRNFINEQNIFL
jgi:hypothetical protein